MQNSMKKACIHADTSIKSLSFRNKSCFSLNIMQYLISATLFFTFIMVIRFLRIHLTLPKKIRCCLPLLFTFLSDSIIVMYTIVLCMLLLSVSVRPQAQTFVSRLRRELENKTL